MRIRTARRRQALCRGSEVLADLLAWRPLVEAGVLACVVDAVLPQRQRVDPVVRRRDVQADEGIRVDPVAADGMPTVDQRHLGVGFRHERVGEREPARARADDEIVGAGVHPQRLSDGRRLGAERSLVQIQAPRLKRLSVSTCGTLGTSVGRPSSPEARRGQSVGLLDHGRSVECLGGHRFGEEESLADFISQARQCSELGFGLDALGDRRGATSARPRRRLSPRPGGLPACGPTNERSTLRLSTGNR